MCKRKNDCFCTCVHGRCQSNLWIIFWHSGYTDYTALSKSAYFSAKIGLGIPWVTKGQVSPVELVYITEL
jgi:hypothetical protein